MDATTSQLIATVILAFLIIFLGFVAYKVRNDPKFQKQDPGKVVIYFLNKYLVTWLLCLQVLAIISEATLVGSASDPDTNVGSSMTLHISMNIAAIIASFLWVRSVFSFVKVIISKKSFGEKFALCLIEGILIVITLALTVFIPFYNMWALANRLDNTIQLELFSNYMQYKLGFMRQASYFASIIEANNGINPGKYAAFANLKGGMVSSIGITIVHVIVMIWEVFFVLKLAIVNKSMSEVMGEDFEEYMKDPNAAKGGKQQAASGNNPPPKKNNQEIQIESVLKFCGVEDPTKLIDWTQKTLRLFSDAEKDPKLAGKMATEWGKAFLGVKKIEGGASKTSEGLTAQELVADVRKNLKDWSNGSLTLPKGKNG